MISGANTVSLSVDSRTYQQSNNIRATNSISEFDDISQFIDNFGKKGTLLKPGCDFSKIACIELF